MVHHFHFISVSRIIISIAYNVIVSTNDSEMHGNTPIQLFDVNNGKYTVNVIITGAL